MKKFNIYSNKDLATFFILLLILAVALLVRFHNLDLVPLNLDESCDTIRGIELIRDGQAEKFLNIPISIYNGKIPVLFNLFALIVSHFFIDPILVARIPSVFFGTLTIFLTYLLGRRLYSNKVGLLSALFLALLPWHIIMSRMGIKIILVPFFGTLIFYLLYAGMKDRKSILFLSSFFALGLGSLYTYPPAMIFIPVFIIYFLILRIKQRWPGLRTVFIGILLFLISILPIFVLSRNVDFLKSQSYHSIFNTGNFNIGSFSDPGSYFAFLKNFILNLKASFSIVFSRGMGLFAPSMNHPLFLSKLFFPLFLFSLIYACYKHKDSDLIMLIWLCLSFVLPSLIVKDGIATRYLFVILPVPIILVARFLMDILDYSTDFKIPVLKISIVMISLLTVGYSSKILITYYKEAPKNKDERIIHSFGSKEAAKFLFEDNISKDYKVFTDYRMVISSYLKYYIAFFKGKREIFGDINKHFKKKLGPRDIKKEYFVNLEQGLLTEGNVIYYFLWSPKTYGKELDHLGKRGIYRRFYNIFIEMHPEEKPVKEICYPDGSVAIEVFKILPN